MKRDFWRGRRVLITGHTGFKGSWLAQWLKRAGSKVTGFSLDVPTRPSLFEDARVGRGIESVIGDIRDLSAVRTAVASARPEVVIHMAAQSLVRPSYVDPVATYDTNVMGTVNLLESLRSADSVRVAVIVTSDKCYENREWVWPYREIDPMGGHDPYSSSKGCAELVAAAFRHSYFSGADAPRIMSVRAGNVIGGGDWARDRLVPDLMRAFIEGREAIIRNPEAIRPWQFVLDPINGYLRAAEEGAVADRVDLPDTWNFGPSADDVRPVRWLADRIAEAWGDGAAWRPDQSDQPHEASTLKLDSSRARSMLGWEPVIDATTAVALATTWYRTWHADKDRAEAMITEQIEYFESAMG